MRVDIKSTESLLTACKAVQNTIRTHDSSGFVLLPVTVLDQVKEAIEQFEKGQKN